MKFKNFYLITFFLLSFVLGAQNPHITEKNNVNIFNTKPIEIKDNFYFFNKPIIINNEIDKQLIQLSEGLKYKLIKFKEDKINYMHYKFILTFQNIPIEGTELNVHENIAKQSYFISGAVQNNIQCELTIKISPELAIEKAQNYANNERLNSDTSINTNSKLNARPELVIINLQNNQNKDSYKLAYRTRVYNHKKLQTIDYYIDANDASLLQERQVSRNNCNNTCQSNTANVKLYGTQTIFTKQFGSNCHFYTRNECTGTHIEILNSSNSNNLFNNNSSSWGSSNQSATSALFCMQVVNDYFRFNLLRNSFDDNFLTIKIKPNTVLVDNAGWTGSDIEIGSASAFPDELITFDVLGHEFTHGVNDFEGNLVYLGESGALDESFADIFGTMVEFYGHQTFNTGFSANYLIGSEVNTLRDMANPKTFGQPDTYVQNLWACTTCAADNGGVHTNSGVQNKWFHLLAEGGSGKNDNNLNFCVRSIGRAKAADIAYRNLTTYISSNSGYAQARSGAIQSAIDLFGAGSEEEIQCTQAWQAVGVGGAYTGPFIVLNQSISTASNVNYNCAVELINSGLTSSGIFTVTSNTEVKISTDFDVVNGANFNAYIAPAICNGVSNIYAARGSNQSTSIVDSNIQQEIVKVEGNDKNSLISKSSNTQLLSDNSIELKIQPNPSSGTFKITLSTDVQLPSSLIIINALGNEVYKLEKINSNEINIDITNVPQGLYVVKVNYQDRIISRKIIKE